MPIPLLELRGVRKAFRGPDGELVPVLDVPTFAMQAGEEVALAGSSGCGKTTLLHVIAGILDADAGEVFLDGEDLTRLPQSARDLLRARKIGYVFQSFHLLQGWTAVENVLLGMAFGPGPDRGRAESLLRTLGLADRMDHLPRQLSVGQQQRVAVARALASRPRLVLADEPTGNLDHRHAVEALELMRATCREEGAGLLVVSHDRTILSRFSRCEDLAALNRAARTAAGSDA